MNVKALVKEISTKVGFTQKDVQAVVDTALEVIKNTVPNEEVSLVGFGKFTVSERAARTMRNPSTGEQVQVPAKKAIHFKPAKSLKDSLN